MRVAVWARNKFDILKKRAKQLEKDLELLQKTFIKCGLYRKCSTIAAELDDVRRKEEFFWHIQSHPNKLMDGDKNMSYFHQKVSQRKKKNIIGGLYNGRGEWKEKDEEIVETV